MVSNAIPPEGEQMERHVIEALGKTKVVIENGKVTYVGEPQVEYCPLFLKYRGIKEITPEIVKENIEFRMKDFGMCTPGRKLRMRDFLSFGVSELMAMAVSKGLLDCAVIACDGAGTVVVTDPELIQGIGGRISGMVETTPYDEIVEKLGRGNVLDPVGGRIDQLAGTRLAAKLGFGMIGVTVVSGGEALSIRNEFGERVVIFAVHTTGASASDSKALFDACDIVSSCASKWTREYAKERSILTVGKKIPVYAATEFGRKLMEERLRQIGNSKEKASDQEDAPRPLI